MSVCLLQPRAAHLLAGRARRGAGVYHSRPLCPESTWSSVRLASEVPGNMPHPVCLHIDPAARSGTEGEPHPETRAVPWRYLGSGACRRRKLARPAVILLQSAAIKSFQAIICGDGRNPHNNAYDMHTGHGHKKKRHRPASTCCAFTRRLKPCTSSSVSRASWQRSTRRQRWCAPRDHRRFSSLLSHLRPLAMWAGSTKPTS